MEDILATHLKQKSRTICILNVPTLKVDFQALIIDQILPGFQDDLEEEGIEVVESEEFESSTFSLILKMKTLEAAERFFGAFNCRYFRDDAGPISEIERV